MSPSDRAWLDVPGNEQTLRLPVSSDSQTATTTHAGRGYYLHAALGGSLSGPTRIGVQRYGFSSY